MTWRDGVMALDGTVFVLYGASLLTSSAMVADFDRFGLTSFRTLTGVLEILGGRGVLIGLRFPGLAKAAAAGLGALMLLGVVVRLRAGDGAMQAAQAALLCALNAWIATDTSRA